VRASAGSTRCLRAGAGGVDLEALVAQRHRDDVDDVRLVVDDEDPRRTAVAARLHARIMAEKPGRLLGAA
jgi:hypothetical protein